MATKTIHSVEITSPVPVATPHHNNPTSRKGTVFGVEEVTDNKLLWRQLLAELIGTMMLVSLGVASCVAEGSNTVSIALCFGLLVATIVLIIGNVSGGHINPAVTVGLLVSGDIKLLKAVLYIAMQILGAMAGAGLLRLALPADKVKGFGITSPSDNIDEAQAFLIELLITFLLVLVVQAVCDKSRNDVKGSRPLAIGLCITACHAACVPLTGSSMNPARSLGPAVIVSVWTSHWVYWAGPMAGGVLGGLIYKYLFRHGKGDSYDL